MLTEQKHQRRSLLRAISTVSKLGRWRAREPRTHLDLLLQSSNWKGLDNGLCWLRLHLCLLPNMTLTHAFVAGLTLVLMRQTPGMVNTPVLFTSLAPTLTREFNTLEHCFAFKPCSVAMAFSKAPLVIAFA